jgi:hypothetical protein
LIIVRSGEFGVKLVLEKSSPLPSFGVLSGSGVLEAVTCAVFVISLLEVTVATSSRVCVPTGTVARTQSPLLEVYVPLDGLLETNVKPVGSLSLMVTFCAALGPAFVKLMR